MLYESTTHVPLEICMFVCVYMQFVYVCMCTVHKLNWMYSIQMSHMTTTPRRGTFEFTWQIWMKDILYVGMIITPGVFLQLKLIFLFHCYLPLALKVSGNCGLGLMRWLGMLVWIINLFPVWTSFDFCWMFMIFWWMDICWSMSWSMIFEGKSQSVGLLPGKNNFPKLQIVLQLEVSVIHFFFWFIAKKIVVEGYFCAVTEDWGLCTCFPIKDANPGYPWGKC